MWFGFIVFFEIVLCVLLFVVNDLGIVISVFGCLVWVLIEWYNCVDFKLEYFFVYVSLIVLVEVIEDVFWLIVCDGVEIIEV